MFLKPLFRSRSSSDSKWPSDQIFSWHINLCIFCNCFWNLITTISRKSARWLMHFTHFLGISQNSTISLVYSSLQHPSDGGVAKSQSVTSNVCFRGCKECWKADICCLSFIYFPPLTKIKPYKKVGPLAKLQEKKRNLGTQKQICV